MKYLAIPLLVLASCVSPSAVTAPAELRAVPQSQSIAMEVLADQLEAGTFTVEQAIPIIREDSEAWDALDRFFSSPLVEEPE